MVEDEALALWTESSLRYSLPLTEKDLLWGKWSDTPDVRLVRRTDVETIRFHAFSRGYAAGELVFSELLAECVDNPHQTMLVWLEGCWRGFQARLERPSRTGGFEAVLTTGVANRFHWKSSSVIPLGSDSPAFESEIEALAGPVFHHHYRLPWEARRGFFDVITRVRRDVRQRMVLVDAKWLTYLWFSERAEPHLRWSTSRAAEMAEYLGLTL